MLFLRCVLFAYVERRYPVSSIELNGTSEITTIFPLPLLRVITMGASLSSIEASSDFRLLLNLDRVIVFRMVEIFVESYVQGTQ